MKRSLLLTALLLAACSSAENVLAPGSDAAASAVSRLNSLADSVAELQSKGRVDKDVNPAAVAGSLVAMLAAVASHQKGFQSWGVKQAELKPNLALLVHLGVTGKKPTK